MGQAQEGREEKAMTNRAMSFVLFFAAAASLPVHPTRAFSQEPAAAPARQEMEIGGVAELIGDKLKEIKGATILTWAGRPGVAGYLPIWTWQTSAGTPIAEFPAVGYRGVLGDSPQAFVTATFNLPGLSSRLFGSQWFATHVVKSKFPPMFFGPAVLLPMDVNAINGMRWEDWKEYASVILSVRISSLPEPRK